MNQPNTYITGANAGGPHWSRMRTRRAARIAQFNRYAESPGL
jgi:hypothetical protein